jgi:predicted component of type VI protein secretion system
MVMTMSDEDATPAHRDAIDLGEPLQTLWEVWNPEHEVMRRKELDHFVHAYERQIKELTNHHQVREYDRAANEAVDMMSISLNYMRMLGYSPSEVAQKVQDRAKLRMEGQTKEILRNYP